MIETLRAAHWPGLRMRGLPLDVPGVDADLSCEEVVNLVRESRQSTERL